jgi:exosortase F-associated protein
MKWDRSIFRIVLGVFCVAGMASVYIFQDAGIGSQFMSENQTLRFILVKTFRFLLNDLLAIGLIASIFPGRGYLLTALVVQVFGLIFFLIPYFVLKVGLGYGDGPLISFLHRLVLNPVLLLLLIPAFFIFGPRRGV